MDIPSSQTHALRTLTVKLAELEQSGYDKRTLAEVASITRELLAENSNTVDAGIPERLVLPCCSGQDCADTELYLDTEHKADGSISYSYKLAINDDFFSGPFTPAEARDWVQERQVAIFVQTMGAAA